MYKFCVALAVLLLCAKQGRSCRFGTTPGVWKRHSWERVDGRGTTLEYNRLDDTPASVWLQADTDKDGLPFGLAWQSLDALCQLENFIAPMLSRVSTLKRNVTILLLGDSLDAQVLDFLCAEYWRRGGTNAFAYVHSHRVTNYCHIGDASPSGARLTLVQMYLLRNSKQDDEARVDSVRKLFDNNDSDAAVLFDGTNRSSLAGRDAEVAIISQLQPDLVVVGGVYWPLHKYADAHLEEQPQVLLPEAQIELFIEDTIALVRHAHATFPGARLAVRTSPQIRTDCAFGSNLENANKRTWGRRMYVDALNNAMHLVSRLTRTEMFDVHTMGSGWQPSQMTGDDIHVRFVSAHIGAHRQPRSWFQLELLNVYINDVCKRAQSKTACRFGAKC
jgi:hypothetical protein